MRIAGSIVSRSRERGAPRVPNGVSKQYPGRCDRGGFPRTITVYLASMYIYYDVNGVNGAGGYKSDSLYTICGQKDDDLRSLCSVPAFIKL